MQRSEPLRQVKIAKSKIHGIGLFAAENIPWGTRIIQYVGEVITDAEAVHREEKMNGDYIFALAPNKNIDGAIRGGPASFINHSRRSPNCCVLREYGQIWIIAYDDIKKGEEMTFDYGDDYYPPKKRKK